MRGSVAHQWGLEVLYSVLAVRWRHCLSKMFARIGEPHLRLRTLNADDADLVTPLQDVQMQVACFTSAHMYASTHLRTSVHTDGHTHVYIFCRVLAQAVLCSRASTIERTALWL